MARALHQRAWVNSRKLCSRFGTFKISNYLFKTSIKTDYAWSFVMKLARLLRDRRNREVFVGLSGLRPVKKPQESWAASLLIPPVGNDRVYKKSLIFYTLGYAYRYSVSKKIKCSHFSQYPRAPLALRPIDIVRDIIKRCLESAQLKIIK